MRTTKRRKKDEMKDFSFVVDEKNNIRCACYDGVKNDMVCEVAEKKALDELTVNRVIENFWDSQPEYYRTSYNTLY